MTGDSRGCQTTCSGCPHASCSSTECGRRLAATSSTAAISQLVSKTSTSRSTADACCQARSTAVNIWQQIVSSCSGAMITALIVTPMDVVKIRLQQQKHPFPKGSCFYYHNGLMDHICEPCEMRQPCEWYQRPGNFKGTLDAFMKITRHEGPTSLWSGLSPTLVMALPATILYYSTYDTLSQYIRQRLSCRRKLSPQSYTPPDFVANGVGGGVARTFAVTVISPLEMVRTKMQSERLSYRDVGVAFRHTVGVHGLKGLTLGLTATLWRDVPFSMLLWGFYAFMQDTWALRRGADRPATIFTNFICSSTAAVVATLFTMPFDVVKTQQQVKMGIVEAGKTKGVVQQLSGIWHAHGVRGLYAGMVPRLAKVVPSCAIMMGTYEYFKEYFRKRNAQKH